MRGCGGASLPIPLLQSTQGREPEGECLCELSLSRLAANEGLEGCESVSGKVCLGPALED